MKDWAGTVSELIQANPSLSACRAQKIGYEIKRLPEQLKKYDKIIYSCTTNSNSGKKHCFRCLPYDECVTKEDNVTETTT